MLRYELITKDNLDLAVKVQNEIFPNENGKKNFIDSFRDHPYRKELKFFLVFDQQDVVGITGIYSYHEYPEDAWLGWFGVLSKYRKKGYGSKMFDSFEDYAKSNGYKNIRLYTDEEDNIDATKLYYKKGMISEEYTNKDDIIHSVGKILIFSKSLTNTKTEKWDNKYLNLLGQEKRQEESNKI